MPQVTKDTPGQLNLADIQGLIVRGYTHPCSVHLMYKFSNAPASLPAIQAFVAALLPWLRNAESWGAAKPRMMLNISFTAGGIQITQPTLNITAFPFTFYKGPWDSAQQSLMDEGPGDPSQWWNKKFANTDVHCIVHVYAMNPEAQAELEKKVTDAAAASGNAVTELKPLISATGRLEQYPLVPLNDIHFAYRDSIDEPDLGKAPAGTDQADLNNFLIGYSTVPNPIPGPTSGKEGDFAANGCYNAFRILYQDVAAFENFLDDQAPKVAPLINNTPAYAREWIAAKMNGRWRNGSPLVLSPQEPDHDTAKATNFGYQADDMQGLKCPFSAHTRVANPRDEGVEVAGSVVVPRIIRRGMPYGPPLEKTNAGEDRGLIGLFLCGDLNGQFETLYGWINLNNFSPVFDPSLPTSQDPLVANRQVVPGSVTGTFTIPMPNGKSVVLPIPDAGQTAPLVMPQFVVTRGTAYSLFPSISSVRKIAGVEIC